MSKQSSEKAADTRAQAVQKLNEMVAGIRIAMLTTLDPSGNLHSRPMATQQFDFDGDFWFFSDDNAPKSHAIQNDDHVNLSFASHDDHRFVSVSGRAQIVHDQEKMRDLWSPLYKTWFPKGLDTPHICLIRVHVESAQFWDSRSHSMVYLIGFAKALATGQRYQPGTNEKLNLAG